jgi:DnaK suppressor protein
MDDGNLRGGGPGVPGWKGSGVMKNKVKAESNGGPGSSEQRSRYAELKGMLEDRRRELQAEVQGKMRDVRNEGSWGGSKATDVLDAVESSEADIQDDIEFALIQMKSETLNKVNDALMRLETGDYGNCFECGEEIAEKRLRALPFAVRCKDCEEARENAEQRERQQAMRRGSSSLFLDM